MTDNIDDLIYEQSDEMEPPYWPTEEEIEEMMKIYYDEIQGEPMKETVDEKFQNEMKRLNKIIDEALVEIDAIKDEEIEVITGIRKTPKRKEPVADEITKPSHYQMMGWDNTMDCIKKILSHEEYIGFLRGSFLKYKFRAGSKAGEPAEKDLAKARQYEKFYEDYIRENTP